jgi:GTP-binding protein
MSEETTRTDPLVIRDLKFLGPMVTVNGWRPETVLPEVAFAGRSNVGKSSLINALTGRLKLARASTEPGRTRELNFFRVGDQLRLVDMPGYGYAKAGKADIARWTGLVRDYLRGRAALKRVVLLIDARHGLKPHDKEVMDALDTAAVIYQIVLTKADKQKPTEAEAVASATRATIAKRPAAHPEIIVTSAETGAGIEQLRAEIAALA